MSHKQTTASYDTDPRQHFRCNIARLQPTGTGKWFIHQKHVCLWQLTQNLAQPGTLTLQTAFSIIIFIWNRKMCKNAGYRTHFCLICGHKKSKLAQCLRHSYRVGENRLSAVVRSCYQKEPSLFIQHKLIGNNGFFHAPHRQHRIVHLL